MSIFVFLEWVGEGKSHFGSEPLIYTLRKQVRLIKGTISSKATIRYAFRKGKRLLHFAEYEELLKKHSVKNTKQDLLWKANLPLAVWRDAYPDFKDLNINAYSLFSSEESLMETLETNELENTF